MPAACSPCASRRPRQAAARRPRGGRIKPRHLATFYSQLADLLHSGVPLLRSLEILERQSLAAGPVGDPARGPRQASPTAPAWPRPWPSIPRAFNELAVSMVRAGQEGGFLEDVLRRIADFTEQQEDLKAKVIGALAYPVFLAVVGFIVLNVLVIFFVPQVRADLQEARGKGRTAVADRRCSSVISHFMQALGLGRRSSRWSGCWYLYRRWARSRQRPAHGGRLPASRCPAPARSTCSLALSRFTRILGTLLHNGIPILQALRIAKDSTGNRVLAQAIDSRPRTSRPATPWPRR